MTYTQVDLNIVSRTNQQKNIIMDISVIYPYIKQCFGSAFSDADADPGKNLHADPGGKGKRLFISRVFFHVLDDSKKC